MTDLRQLNRQYRLWRDILPVSMLLLAAALSSARADEPIYLKEDAVLSGRQMINFAADGRDVDIVLGDFKLVMGQRELASRDGVVWVLRSGSGDNARRDIEIYLEGDVRIVGADGSVTTDRRAFVTVHQQGTLSAEVGSVSKQPATDLPIYVNALAARKESLAAPAVVLPAAAMPQAALSPGGAPASLPASFPPGALTTGPTSRPAATEPAAKAPQPITFLAQEGAVSEEWTDPENPNIKRRITVAREVYLAQGSPQIPENFVEMRAAAAVVYSAPSSEGSLAGERISGVYLDGDVMMRRGERTVRGQRMFYDFDTGKAIIIEPVMRMVQEQRRVPVYLRAKEGRQVATRPAKEGERPELASGTKWELTDAVVTTSDFYTPSFSFAAKKVTLEETTGYVRGEPVTARSWQADLVNTTFNVGKIPLLWAPYLHTDAEEGATALRSVNIGQQGQFGFGVETEWNLFRLLGLPRPEGFRGTLEADWYERGPMLGARVDYQREKYNGYLKAYGFLDQEQEDRFGTDLKDIPAPEERGWFQWRHKQFNFPGQDWETQAELAYVCDKNFLQEFFPWEYWTEKPQETLLYAKQQRDNWALTVLAQARLNDFQTTTESYPDIGAYLLGQSLWQDTLTLYSESHAGFVRFRPAEGVNQISSLGSVGSLDGPSDDDTVARADTRQEVDWPLTVGPIKLQPWAAGRMTYWSQTAIDNNVVRPWGQLGMNATTHLWRYYDTSSRLWDLNGIRHVITPFGGIFGSCDNVQPDQLQPMNPDIEQYISRLGGGRFGMRNLWQTRRGVDQHMVNWLRWDIEAIFFSNPEFAIPADGRYFASRPELSIPRNAINTEASMQVSDSTVILGSANYDLQSSKLGRGDIGVAVARDPRLRYYVGLRSIPDLNATVGTFGVNYKINRKYELAVFEQYDFDLNGHNNVSSVSLVRKFPRFYGAVSYVYDRATGASSFLLSVWPEGIPELKLGGNRISPLLTSTDIPLLEETPEAE